MPCRQGEENGQGKDLLVRVALADPEQTRGIRWWAMWPVVKDLGRSG